MIVGATATGKSTLAWKFREFLRSEGFSTVDVIDLDESFPPAMNEDRFAALDRTSKIMIETVQANKRSVTKKD